MNGSDNPIADLFASCRALGLTPDGVMLGELGERMLLSAMGSSVALAAPRSTTPLTPTVVELR